MTFSGLSGREAEASRQKYGLNERLYKESFGNNLLHGFCGLSCKLFIIAALIRIVLLLLGLIGVCEPASDYSAIFILFGLAILCGLFEADLRYVSHLKMNRLCASASSGTYKVMRSNGKTEDIAENMLAVGDVVFILEGDFIPADGIMSDGSISVDQSRFGILEKAEKTPPPSGYHGSKATGAKNPYCVYCGTVVHSGSGAFKITAVGENTAIAEKSRTESVEFHDEKFSGLIRIGTIIGAACAAVVLIFSTVMGAVSGGFFSGFLNGASSAAVILAVTCFCGKSLISEASAEAAIGKLFGKGARIINPDILGCASEITTVFADKTGVFTDGGCIVSGFIDGGGSEYSRVEKIDDKIAQLLKAAVLNTSSAQLAPDGTVFGGSAAERAVLEFIKGASGEKSKVKKQAELSSESIFGINAATVNLDGKLATFVCGEAELVLERCGDSFGSDGKKHKITNRDALVKLAATISLTGKDVIAYAVAENGIKGGKLTGENFSLVGLVVLHDPVCEGADAAVSTLKKCGARTVLITESTRGTAIYILNALGMKKSKGVIIDSEQLSKMSDSELERRFSEIKAVANATADDKKRMLRTARKNGEKILMAVTSMSDIRVFEEADAAMASVGCVSSARKLADISSDGCGIKAIADLFSVSAKFTDRCRVLLAARAVCTVILGILAILSVIGW